MTNPFFIVGTGRNGSTLLRTMLNHHDRIGIPLEGLFILDYLRSGEIEKQKKLIEKECEFQEWDITLSREKLDEISSSKELIEYIHQQYLEVNEKEIWGHKTPRFVKNWEVIHDQFPEAKFIHLIRDPRGVCNSFVNSDIHQTNVYYMSRRWNKDVRKGLELEKALEEKTVRITYESLLRHPEQTLKKICAFLNVSYDDKMLRYYKKGSEEYRSFYDDIHENLDKSLKTDRIDAWKEELSDNEICYIEDKCSKLMEEVGYDTITDKKWPSYLEGVWRLQRFFLFFRQLSKYLFNRPDYVYSFLRRKIVLNQTSTPEINT